MVGFWHKQDKSMDPSCLVWAIQDAGGVMVWHTLNRLEATELCFSATAYLCVVAEHVHPFMTTVPAG